METKMSMKEKISKSLESFKEIYSLEQRDDVSPDELISALKKCLELDDGIISQDSITEVESVLIPNLNSIFGKEVAFYKCKALLRTTNLNLLTKIRVCVEEFRSTLKEVKHKNVILDNLYDVLSKYMSNTLMIKSEVNSGFENKEKFLRACQSCMTRHYRGMLNLNNSPIQLGKVVHKVMHSTFDDGGPRKSESIEKEFNLHEYLSLVQYYVDREVLQKTDLSYVNNFVNEKSNAIVDMFKQLPQIPNYDLDSMLQFMVMANNGVEATENPSDAQGNAITWTTIVNEMNGIYNKGIEIFNKNIKPRLGVLGSMDLKEMCTCLDRLEELYKVNDDSGDILKYITLLNGMIVGYDLFVKLEVYDILSFITGTEYLTFMFIITYMVFETFRRDNLASE